MSMSMDKLLEILKKRSRRTLHTRIRDDHVLDPGYQAGPILPHAGYFEVRLAEMFLSYRSEYGRSFVPMVVVATEFGYGGEVRSVPFFVGTDLLRDLDAYVKGEDVSFRNTRAVGPVPYLGGDVAVFVGLYRAQVDDLARRLLEVLGQVVSVFDVSRLASYLSVAGKLADGLYSLLDFKQIEYRTGDRDVFQDHGSRRFEAGFFVHANCPEDALAVDELWVRDGVLMTGRDAGSLQRLRDHDYCLMEVQASTVRQDYTSLPFHDKWKLARERIAQGDEALAHTLFVECCQLIANSHDLTPGNAESLIQAYQANYAKELAFYRSLAAPAAAQVPVVYRGDGGPLQPQQSIMKTVDTALGARVTEASLLPLVELSQNWDRVPQRDSLQTELTDALLNEQLAAIRAFTPARSPDPKGLANALAIASVTAV